MGATIRGAVIGAASSNAWVLVGATPKDGITCADVLAYVGLAFQIAGLLLAAKGISDVRREWTQRPGIWGRTKVLIDGSRRLLVHRFWIVWNLLARRLGWPRHVTTASVTLGGELSAAGSLTAKVIRGRPPVNGTPEERLAWLEERVWQTMQDLDGLRERVGVEREARESGDKAGQEALSSEVGKIQNRMSDLAGGGLRLQAIGVAALLVGITLGTIPDQLARLC